ALGAAEDLEQVQLRVTEHRVHRCVRALRAAVDERHQILADLEADVRAARIDRGPLEQELRVGASDLDLDRPARRELRPLASKVFEVQAERVDVLADPHAYVASSAT